MTAAADIVTPVLGLAALDVRPGDTVRVFAGYHGDGRPLYVAVVVVSVHPRRHHTDLRVRPLESYGDYTAGVESWCEVVADADVPYVMGAAQ